MQVFSGPVLRSEGKAMRRGAVLLLEAKLTPQVGERIFFPETQEWFRVRTSEAQGSADKIDHYRVEGDSIRG